MTERVSGFDWDEGNHSKCQKHGVSIEEIETVFRAGPDVYAGPAHSADEPRRRAIGRTPEGPFVLVAFTIRQKNAGTLIRPISARYMHDKEVRHYERQKS